MTTAPLYISYYQSPLGTIEIKADENFIIGLNFVAEKKENISQTNTSIDRCTEELNQYFAGKRQNFTVAYKLAGTDFQKSAWQSLTKIPFGKTKSYQEQAESIKNPKAVRAIGRANGANKILIIVPCHRVIGKDGSLTGFGAEIWRKKWLLEHENKTLKSSNNKQTNL